MKHVTHLVAVCLFGLAWPAFLFAQSESEDSKGDAESQESSAISIEGYLESTSSVEVKIDPKEWTAYVVDEAAEHGQKVQRGDTLISFKTDDYEKAVRSAELELELAKLGLESATSELEAAKKTMPLEMKAAEDADREATQALKEYLTHGKELRLQSLEQSLASSRNALMYQEEELKQLERMYEADDLTEETEEIILIRTRNAVDQAKHSFELAKDRHRRAKEYDIPKEEDSLETAVQQAALALEKARVALPQKISQQEMNLEKQTIAVQEQEEKLSRLREDNQTFRVDAPQSGIVYYGPIQRGKISDSSSASLEVGTTAKPGTVLMTIVDPNQLVVRVVIPEDKLRHATAGTECEIECAAYPDQPVPGKIESVSPVPIAPGTFAGTVEAEWGNLKNRLVPGLKATCRIPNE